MIQLLKNCLTKLFPPSDLADSLINPQPVGPAIDRQGQAHELVLYMFLACGYCQRVLIVIERNQIPVNYRDTHLNPVFRQKLKALNGKTQVPCLLIDGKPLLESAAIIAYLETHFSPDQPLKGP